MNNLIQIRGAREHNLKNIDLDIPKNKLVVISGISGSGKSSLAFDTLYAEGQRRYVESLSSYARQFLQEKAKPDVDSIEGLSPAISIDQKSTSHNPRSTVGTVTEIYDYLRLLFAKIGIPHCVNCGSIVRQATVDEIVDQIIAQGTHDREVKIFAPAVKDRKGEYSDLISTWQKEGFDQVRIDGQLTKLSQPIQLDKNKRHSLELVVDQFTLNSNSISRLVQAIELAAEKTGGHTKVIDQGKELSFNLQLMCSQCGTSADELEPRSFSFNSPYGACLSCDGLGVDRQIDPSLIIPDENATIAEGGIMPWSYSAKNWYGFLLNAVAEHFAIDTHRPIKNLKADEKKILLVGTGKVIRIPAISYSGNQRRVFNVRFDGLVSLIKRRWAETESESIRRDLERYMTELPCSECHGSRLKPTARSVTINQKTISELCSTPIEELITFFQSLDLSEREKLIANRVVKEVLNRLEFLGNVGLNYLTLGRTASTLAGGEAQRIRLASQIGSRLTGVLYVLDEPSIGLHARDNSKLIEVLKSLRDLGNTVVVVEHDEETIEAADHLVDIGPGAGKHGGNLVAAGTPQEVAELDHSITGRYLAGKDVIEVPQKRRSAKQYVSVYGARENNLKRANLHLPLGVFTCITGVSGSGKSTLLTEVLYQALARKLNRSLAKPGAHERLEGAELLNKVSLISQTPIGRTPRSNPATYTGVFTAIRELFTSSREAKIRGYKPGRFSFNVSGGRCEACQGDGTIKIEMQFLPDVFVPCDVCQGRRYNRETLAVKFAGKSIADVLEMTVEEALFFFRDFPKIANRLELLSEVGLGYLELGQPATTLSGGEAQRIKLATELSRRTNQTLYILDEPTTGLHQADIRKLLEVLNKLVERGNTVAVIEHNLDVIKTADWIIDLGPEGGEAGGKIIAKGTPEEVSNEPNSYTGQFLKKTLKRKQTTKMSNDEIRMTNQLANA